MWILFNNDLVISFQYLKFNLSIYLEEPVEIPLVKTNHYRWITKDFQLATKLERL